MEPDLRPGPWLRLLALAAAAATAGVVAAGSAGGGALHRALALAALAPLVAIAVAARAAHPGLRAATAAALGLLGLAVAIGGAIAVTGHDAWLARAHVAAAAGCLAAVLVLAARTRAGRVPPPGAWRDYVILTKPRIMSLLLLTGACGMCVAARGLPPAGTAAATLAGLSLACGGAAALNHVMDRDIDVHMRRTDRRPVAAGRVPPQRAMEFGLALVALSFVLLAAAANLLTALLALAGALFYVVVYTGYLKRRTVQNIVIGGAAGAVPPVVGYAAVSGRITLAAALLFLIVFVWTPPHFWALALLIRRDYEAAGVPMLPVLRGESETARQILLYTALLIAVSLLPAAAGIAGPGYAAVALLLGARFAWLAGRLRASTTPQAAGRLFHYSLLYLALVFVALAVAPGLG